MRRYLFVIAMLSLGFWLVTAVWPTAGTPSDGNPIERVTGWRRTEYGWEEASHWQSDVTPITLPTPLSAVHPLVIASLELMVSVGVLVAGSTGGCKTDR